MATKAIYKINDYILNGSDVGTLLGWPNKSGIRPIVATQDAPEVQNSKTPWIVYSVRTTNDIDCWWLMRDDVTFIIYHNDADTLNDVGSALIKLFKTQDAAAENINAYLRGNNDGDYEFQYSSLTHDLSPDPASAEAGVMAKMFVFRVGYLDNSD